MDNYWIVGLVIAAVVLLIILLIKRNRKDQKQFEKETIASEIKPELHDEEHT